MSSSSGFLSTAYYKKTNFTAVVKTAHMIHSISAFQHGTVQTVSVYKSLDRVKVAFFLTPIFLFTDWGAHPFYIK